MMDAANAVNVEDIYKLTPMQQGLLFHAVYAPKSDVYFEQLMQVEENLDAPNMIRAWQRVVARHPILRTVFLWENLDEPMQVVQSRVELPVEQLDWRELSSEAQKDRLEQFLKADRKHGFDFGQAPLLRLIIIRRSESAWTMVNSYHHILLDGWSMKNLLDEVRTWYNAFRQGRSPDLPQPRPFRDYIAWLQRQDMGAAESFWRKKLRDLASPSFLGATRVPGNGDGREEDFEEQSVKWPPELGPRLQAFARRNDLTINHLLQAAWAMLLSRYSGKEDVLFGLTLHGRPTELVGFEAMIGLFINTVPVRLKVPAAATVSGWLKTVREESAELLRFQYAPLVKVHGWSGVPGSQPLFDNLLVFEGAPGEEPERNERFRFFEKTNYPLMVSFKLEGLRLIIAYDRGRCETSAVSRMFGHIQTLLHGILASAERPEQKLRDLPLLTSAEEHQIRAEWNDTRRDYPRGPCVHELFEGQVKRTPDRIAAAYEDQSLTYRVLNQRANRLARYLADLGIGPESPVGICVERSLEMLIGLLAVLKAGGAYVPLNPGHPRERIAFMLQDSRIRVLLTHSSIGSRLAFDGALFRIVCLDQEIRPSIADDGDPGISSGASNLVYVIYTSGTTGQPKGAMNSHAGVVNRLTWMQEQYALEAADRVLQKTPFSFDVSVWEFFWPLMAGAALVMARPEGHRDSIYLAELIRREGITTLHFVPSMLQVFIDRLKPADGRILKRVFCSGEALPFDLAGRFFSILPEVQLHNLYGPTECAVDATFWDCRTKTSGRIPIGRPVANTRVYVLDTNGRLVPIGIAGELHIGGVQVARGYLNRPDLSAAAFIPDPFNPDPGARLYKTGDLCHRLPNGDIEYLGRTDFQVKIRGVRIELGEIESVLIRHAQIREAVVLCREDRPEDKRLAAYLVPAEGHAPDFADLRAQLMTVLPEYMVPAAFVILDAIPLTANGKADRKALPAPEYQAPADTYTAPRTAAEEVLARIFSEILNIERVGIHDDFFELGGHSLSAMTLLERMHQNGLQVDLPALFNTPTIAELATAGSRASMIEIPANRIPAQCDAITPEMLPLVNLSQTEIDRIITAVPGGAANVQDIYPLAPLQEGILFHHRMSTAGDAYLLCSQFRFDTRTRLDDFLSALQKVIDRHDILRTAVIWEDLSEPLQVVWRHASLPIQEVVLDPAAGAVAEQLYRRFHPRHTRIDVRQAPLLRAHSAFDPSRNRWLLLILFHHLVDDSTTFQFVIAEIQAYLLKQEDQLPKPLPFRNFVAQTRLGLSEEEHRKFFEQMLGDVEEPTTPFGLLNVQGDGTGIHEAYLAVDMNLAGRMRERCRRLKVSAASLCHLAWAQVLARVAGQADIVFGTVLFGRMQGGAGADRMLGMFINTLPIRIRIGGQGAGDGVQHVHALLADLLRHEHASLALAQRCSRVPAPTPLFSALLNYRHVRDAAKALFTEAAQAWEGVEHLSFEERTNYPLTLAIDDWGTDFSLTAQVQAPIEPMRVAVFMHTALEQLVETLEQAPQTPLRILDILPKTERMQLIEEFNRTEAEYPKDRCVHQLFEEQADRTPQSIALVFEDQSLTYDCLNRRANRLARFLRTLGAEPDILVGLCLERSLDMVIGLLAILKAGGAYVPLDPHYPRERLAFMLTDSKAQILLTQSNQLPVKTDDVEPSSGKTDDEKPSSGKTDDVEPSSGSPQPPAPNILCLDTEWSPIAAQPSANPKIEVHPANLAYVIYTSGSTGRPKGVAISHRALVNLLESMGKDPGLDAGDVFLAVTNLSFDIAGLELYLPLVTGARLVIAARETVLDGEALCGLAEKHSVTTMQATPATWRMLMGAGRPHDKPLKAWCGGETLPRDLANSILEKGGPLWNLYGPTETTIWSSLYPVKHKKGFVGIGRPIGNTRLHILDAAARPAPIGVAGDLYIGGAGLARGYRYRPDQTAERFIPDPFGAEAGGRLYRTGDRARYWADGNIEFLERVDTQVKIRGFRIELGEIESTLMRQRGVREAVAAAQEDRSGNKQLIAYIVEKSGEAPSPDELRRNLREQLPEYMVPSFFMKLARLPLTPNGKVDRKALPAPDRSRGEPETGYRAPRSAAERTIAHIWREVLGLDQVGVNDHFFDVGGHSLLLTKVQQKLKNAFPQEIPLRDLFRHTTVADLARYFAPIREQSDPVIQRTLERLAMRRTPSVSRAVAIIGLAGRFPGANSVEQFWENLRQGKEGITFFKDEELLNAGLDPQQLKNPDYVKARPILADSGSFDAHFFGINPREAEIMDPQQRVFLEQAWLALEHAGYEPKQYPGRIGVYAGAADYDYYWKNLQPRRDELRSVNRLQIMFNNSKDYLATQVSYKLNLRGPSLTVQTACSTSLVAVHAACQSLIHQECDMALAGGITIHVPQVTGYLYSPGSIVSPDGHCRPFDAQSGGTIFGDGVGLVVLKRLEEALRDGDVVYAVIKGSAVNNDGDRKIGYTAPSEDGQVEVISEALAVAEVEPRTISYVEAHGTATTLGDPIEVAALTRAFGNHTPSKPFCALGSVKSNIGHLDAAAGVAGLIKTILCLKNKELVPSLHFREPNPGIRFDDSPFYVNTRLKPWETNGFPRRAGVSSFGIGGTNAHLVLEEAPPAAATDSGKAEQLLLLSAKTAGALQQAARNAAAFLRKNPRIPLADAAYTLQVGRRAFEHRRALVCADAQEAASALETNDPERVPGAFEPLRHRPIYFMFPGQGAQYPNMGSGLYREETLFREIVDHCAEILRPHLGLDLRRILFPFPGTETQSREQLDQTAITQPALFVIEYALAELWQSWGMQPEAMIGHSIGEYTAACLAGVWSLEEALALVAQRGRLIQALPAGAMLGAALPEAEIKPLMEESLAIAAVNGPKFCTVSGPAAAVDRLESRLKKRNIFYRRLRTSHAFHSAMTDPILEEFAAQVKKTGRRAPRIPFLSNLTGTWITAEQATDPGYWAKHLRQTVRFGEGLGVLLKETDSILLEVGPGHTLSVFAKQQPMCTVFHSLPLPDNKQADRAFLLNRLGRLWLAGVAVDWRGFYRGERRKRLALPTYPFERQRYWIDPQPASLKPGRGVQPAPPDAEAAQDSPLPTYARPALPDAYAGPRNDIERRLLALWEQLLGVHSLGIDDNFFDLGGHSLLAIQLITRIKEAYQIDLPVAVIAQTPTVRDLAEFIGNHTRERPWSPLVPLRKAGSRRPLYCIHPVTGTVLCYMDLARHLPPEQTVYAFQAPGFEKGQKTRRSVAEMAKDYLDAVYEAQPEGPYYFCGWSAGGIIAYEMAQQALAADKKIGLLAVLDTFPLIHPTDSKLLGSIALLYYSLTQAMVHLKALLKTIHFQSLGIVNIFRRIKTIMKLNYMTLTYDMKPYDGTMILFQTERHAKIMKQNPGRSIASYVKGGLRVIEVPGDHLMIVYEPNVRVLASHLRQLLSIHQTDNVASSATGHTVGKSNR